MDWKLLGSTFTLIFLAELGDKTQLAAFAATAGSKSPWSIFAGASAALVLSTLLAVLFGDTIQRWVPQHYLKLAAGVLFVVFGIVLVVAGLRPGREEAAAAVPGKRPSVFARFVLGTAENFERAAAHDYEALAAHTDNPRLAALLRSLAADENRHLAAIRTTLNEHGQAEWAIGGMQDRAPDETFAPEPADGVRDTLMKAIEHERATAGFYRELAAAAPLPSLRAAFASLAAEEERHAQALEAHVA